MKFISTLALAAAVAATLHAQDSTVTTRTEVKADDATAVIATGCLVAGVAPGSFALRGGITGTGDEVTTKSRVETEVNRGETSVKAESSTKADGGRERVRAGGITMFDLNPRTGVELGSHVGKQVQVTAVMVDRGKDSADVTIKEESKVERDNARDAKASSETKLEVERGRGNTRLTVLSVKQLAATCAS